MTNPAKEEKTNSKEEEYGLDLELDASKLVDQVDLAEGTDTA